MIIAPDFCMDRGYPERRKPATTPSPSEGITPDQGETKVVAAVATGWGALISEWKLRLRKLDRESWYEPSKARAKELRRCIADAKRAMRGHPNDRDVPTSGTNGEPKP